MNVLDNQTYIARVMRDNDAAEAQIAAAIAQAARRFVAIDQAERRLRAIAHTIRSSPLDRAAIDKLLSEVADDLGKANQVRATDMSDGGKENCHAEKA